MKSGGRERDRDYCIAYDFTLLQTCWSTELASTFTYGSCYTGPGSLDERLEKSIPAYANRSCAQQQLPPHQETSEHSDADLETGATQHSYTKNAGNGNGRNSYANGNANGYAAVNPSEQREHMRSMSSETLSDEAAEQRERILQHPLPVLTVSILLFSQSFFLLKHFIESSRKCR